MSPFALAPFLPQRVWVVEIQVGPVRKGATTLISTEVAAGCRSLRPGVHACAAVAPQEKETQRDERGEPESGSSRRSTHLPI